MATNKAKSVKIKIRKVDNRTSTSRISAITRCM